MNLQVKPFHPEAHKEDPVYRFNVMDGEKVAVHLFDVPVSRLRTASDRNDLRRVAVNHMNEADIPLDNFSSIADELAAAFRDLTQ